MKDENSSAMSIIATTIIEAIKEKINNAPYDKTVRGIIVQKIDQSHYIVEIKKNEYKVTAIGSHEVGDQVFILIPQNNYNDMVIMY